MEKIFDLDNHFDYFKDSLKILKLLSRKTFDWVDATLDLNQFSRD